MSYKDFVKQLSARTQAEELAAFQALAAEWPDAVSQANFAMLLQHHRDKNRPMTPEALKTSFIELDAEGRISVKTAEDLERDKQIAASEAEEERKQLLKEVAKRLRRKGLPVQSVEIELKNKFSWLNLDELRAKVLSADEAKRLRQMSKDELAQESRANAVRTHGENPTHAKAPILPAEHTAASLKLLAKTNYAAFKELVRVYGTQVDERLGWERPVAPGVTVGGRI